MVWQSALHRTSSWDPAELCLSARHVLEGFTCLCPPFDLIAGAHTLRLLAHVSAGTIAGSLSVWGYHQLTPKLQSAIGLQDTCGVHNLHGMPGILGGIVVRA